MSLTLADRRYDRVWGEGIANSDWAPPVVFDEKVYNESFTEPDYDLTHYAMLYQRHVPELDRYAKLLRAAAA